MLRYQDLLDIGLSPDAETLQARLIAAVGQLGFGLCSGMLIRGRIAKNNIHSFGNPPDGFQDVFISTDLCARDPFVAALQAQPGCHVYDQAFYVQAGVGELWEHYSAFGYRHGMAISAHEFSHAESFCFGVDSHDPLPNDKAALFRLQGYLQLLAQHAHAASKRLHTPAPAVDLNTVSREEADALQWAADAQSVWLTRGKVVISKHGAAQHRAMAKVGATSAPIAILRAIEGGLIDR